MSSTKPQWLRSTFCGADGCVEVAEVGEQVWLRDSKLGESSPVLKFWRHEFVAFRAGMLAQSGGFAPVGEL